MTKSDGQKDGDIPQHDLGQDALETGRVLFAGSCAFVKSVVKMPDLPPEGPIEIAFAGRSNVGKSSLLNALTGHNSLARTSNTPGRTQALNYFDLGEGRLWLVDMPGYGYAKVPKHLVEGWTQLIHDYLRGRATLRLVCVLVDARHGFKQSDLSLMEGLNRAAVAYQIVFTKADKVSGGQLDHLMQEASATLKKNSAAFPTAISTSSKKDKGIAELRAVLAKLALA